MISERSIEETLGGSKGTKKQSGSRRGSQCGSLKDGAQQTQAVLKGSIEVARPPDLPKAPRPKVEENNDLVLGQSLKLYPEEPQLQQVPENKFQTVVKSKQEQLHDQGVRHQDETKSSPPIQEKKSATKVGDMANKSPTMNDIPD